MRKLSILFFCLFISFAVFAQSEDPNLGIIPAPKEVKITAGKFTFSRESGIVYENPDDRKAAQLFHDFLKETFFLDIPVAKNFVAAPKGLIRFSSAEYTGTNPEGYSLSVTREQINVSGKGPGLFYGLQSLMQMMPLEKEGSPKIPCVEISDEPRYQYRGMHLDVCRHFFPVEFVKKYIDLMAQYKLNTFHWHLTDDQGWRIEIKKYPELTRIGAFRDQTLIGNYHDRMPQWFDNTPYGGYYTQEQIKEVVAYAASKYITVIPEIEMPGHALAALASYPELACGDHPGPFKVAQKWGVFDDVYCPGKENTFKFLENVLSEVIELFPSAYIHIGGDECPKTQWRHCKYCQKRMRQNHLKNEEELQSYFVHRIEKFLNSKGRQIIGWDEILQGGLAPNATVMSWTGVQGGISAAKQNHNAIMTPGSFVYFDHLQGKSTQEPLSIGGYTPLKKVYSYNPTPTDLTPLQQSKIIGVQANLWTEYIATPQKVEYMVLPRMLALSEIAWTIPERKDYMNFSETRVPLHLARIDKTSTLYRVPTAFGIIDTTFVGNQFAFQLKPSVTGARIYYTIDGYTPDATTYEYEKPINITVPEGEKRIVKTIVITPSGKKSAVTTTVLNNMPPLSVVQDSVKGKGLKYYLVPGEFKSVAQIDTLKAAEKGTTLRTDVSNFRRRFKSYGIVFDGYISIPADGIYTFTTTSDDGSAVWIDNQEIVDNDKRHAAFAETGGVRLLKGLHKIEVRYFQVEGGQFNLLMGQPGAAKYEIPSDSLFN